jgi:hypothetical protein
MTELPPLGECITRLHSRIGLHHDAADFLFKTHPTAKLVQMFVAAALNRSISLVRGFCALIPDNYLCAAPLVRVQLDGVLRFSALSLVADPEDFVRRATSGEKINNLKDRDGHQMRDGYLVKRLAEQYPGVEQGYEDGCGYVHFSEAHFFHVHTTTPEGRFCLQIGDDAGVTEDDRKDAVFMMDQNTRLLLVFVERYLRTKDASIRLLPAEWNRTYSPA